MSTTWNISSLFRFATWVQLKILHKKKQANEQNDGRSMKNLPAFTLFESTVAVTIIAIVIGLSTLIYANVIDSERPVGYYQAKQELDKIFQETKKTKAFFSKNFSFATYEIKQKVDFHKGNKKLYQIDYTITSAEKQWWAESHLIANTKNER